MQRSIQAIHRLQACAKRAAGRLLLSCGCLLLVAAGGETLGQSLTGYWSFEGNLQDSVGGNHGSVFTGTGGPITTSTSGIVGNAVEFGATGTRRVELPTGVIPTVAGPTGTRSPFSISVWDFTPSGSNTGANDGYLFASGMPSATVQNFYVRRYPSAAVASGAPDAYAGGIQQFLAGSGFTDGGSGAFSKGVWHHHVITYDAAGVARWYIDGSLRMTDSSTNTLNGLAGSLLVLGNRIDGDRGFVNGKLDELQIYNGALNNKQVALLRDQPNRNLAQFSKFMLANASFEAPAVFTSSGAGTASGLGSITDGTLANVPIAGWGESGSAFVGADGPNTHPSDTSPAVINPKAMHGNQAAFLALRNSAAAGGAVTDTWLFQSLGVVEPEDVGTRLDLTALIAARQFSPARDGAEGMIAFATGVGVGSLGTNVGDQLATALDSSVLQSEGFHELAESLTIDASLVGQELFARLSFSDTTPSSTADVYFFDNIQLFVTPLTVPEPSSFVLFGACAAVGGVFWRRRQTAA